MSPVPGPMIRRFDHVGVIVNDLAEARRWLAEVFGMPLRRTVELTDGRIRGEFYSCGDVDIEVLGIGDPEMRPERLGDGKQARIEHIAVEGDGVKPDLARQGARGRRTTSPEPRRTESRLHV